MSTWILIISMSVPNGIALESAEFTSKEKCEIAQAKVVDGLDSFIAAMHTVCVEK